MKKTSSDDGQTFSLLEMVVSSVGAWNSQTEEGQMWLIREVLPHLGWGTHYFFSLEGHAEFKSWVYFIDNLLHSLGYLGNAYQPQLYFAQGRPALRWPLLGHLLRRDVVETHPEMFSEEKVGLVYVKPPRAAVDDMFIATIIDTDEIDHPEIPGLEVAVMGPDRHPVTLKKGESIPSALLRRYPESELIVMPWRVEMDQGELARWPFCCGPDVFRKAAPSSPRLAIQNLARDRAGVMGLPVPDWLQSLSGKELAALLNPSKPNLGQQLLDSEPDNEDQFQDFLRKISRGGGFSPAQWELLIELADVRGGDEFFESIRELEKCPAPGSTFWSQILDEVLALIRFRGRGRSKAGLAIVACDEPGCWRRFVLRDSRTRYCPVHRQSRAAHKNSQARQARRQRERFKVGDENQRARWAEQKRRQRVHLGE